MRVLLSISAVLVLANCVVIFFQFGLRARELDPIIRLFHLSLERNVPTFFAVLLLLLAALVSSAAGRIAETGRFRWTLLGIVFTFLSFDEFAELHERLIVPVRNSLGTSGFFHFAWIIPYSAFVLVLAVFYLRWLSRLPTRIRRLLVVSAVVYLAGAVVMESVSGWYLTEVSHGRNVVYALLTTVEETCEMVGVIVYVYAVSLHIRDDLGGLRISLGEKETG